MAWRSSSTNLEVQLLVGDGVCVVSQDQQVSLRLHCLEADVLEKLLDVFLAVWRAFRNSD